MNPMQMFGNMQNMMSQFQQYGNQLAQNVTQTCCPKPVPAYVVPNPGCGCNGGYLG